ncbi:PREDICTED: uncharacterized protein LOC104753949 [Camelina sativa]|uniref:Uncharacterized protein LOC104753949 n=1 Tax=Camelina sativa TaxID=90675 RepID=A0ABM0WPX5_CAMSA|nr:PREDICTED: uncharacterized protein LOC104753949 [Camelina sativa]
MQRSHNEAGSSGMVDHLVDQIQFSGYMSILSGGQWLHDCCICGVSLLVVDSKGPLMDHIQNARSDEEGVIGDVVPPNADQQFKHLRFDVGSNSRNVVLPVDHIQIQRSHNEVGPSRMVDHLVDQFPGYMSILSGGQWLQDCCICGVSLSISWCSRCGHLFKLPVRKSSFSDKFVNQLMDHSLIPINSCPVAINVSFCLNSPLSFSLLFLLLSQW